MADVLSLETASRFARVALGHVTREYPSKLDHVMADANGVRAPRRLHPIFFGSFDWHSCVHAHWLLTRLCRRIPALPEADRIRQLLDSQFTPDKVAGEVAYLLRPEAHSFERPYGWAWLLMLESELARHGTDEGRRWATVLQPLAEIFVRRFEEFLPLATYPARAGTHSNTAFALLLTLEYSEAIDDRDLSALCRGKARAWYGRDRDCQAWEPSLDEFLSPALIEAALMRRVLAVEEFSAWFAQFLPAAARGAPVTLFEPATVSDRQDGKIVHLDGLNLSRAWCWRLIIDGLPLSDPLRGRAEQTIAAHLRSALERINESYMGGHWLASFALLALDPYPT